jgi:hypothetical protein
MEDLKKPADKTSKSVIINGDIHAQLKSLCAGKNLKMGGVIENLILLYLKDYKNVQKQIDNLNEPVDKI